MPDRVLKSSLSKFLRPSPRFERPRCSSGRQLMLGPLLGLAALSSCSHLEPPGARDAKTSVTVRAPHSNLAGAAGNSELDAALPFVPTGTKLASIAWRTWIYTDTTPKRTRYGYLRMGEVVDARGPEAVNDGCRGGWYRVNPRGFVCLGKGATLDLNDPLLPMSAVRPVRGQSLPYRYVRAGDPPPLLYFKLPSARQWTEIEGDRSGRIAIWKERVERMFPGYLASLGTAPPFLLNGASLVKPYGVKQPLRYQLHAGRAGREGGFALQSVFTHEGRVFGLTTEHDLIALDNTEPATESALAGVQLQKGEDLPVGFVKLPMATRYELLPNGEMRVTEALPKRTAVKLSGKKRQAFYELTDGSYVPAEALLVVPKRDTFASFATGTRKWIDVSILSQTLVAYEGRHPAYVTLVSTGRGVLADPETTLATVTGTFMIHTKHITATMDGDEDRADSLELRDVPFVQYFHKGYAFHGVYWHDDFGKVRSHGCINLAPRDAAWLFDWTDPQLPQGWHSVINLERGTVVLIHP
ncbi:MAG: L,D-transpeptidase [Polyangiaceae bacterium]|nr:L,D-transpeptidase [Polyangiaceae bacterium]